MGSIVVDENSYEIALKILQSLIPKIYKYDTDDIIKSKNEVINRYGKIFSVGNIENITENEFYSFLLFKNNHHWNGLHRKGSQICSDMNKLKISLKFLLNEDLQIKERIDYITDTNHVPGFGKAIYSAILLVNNPNKYGVWNGSSESGLKQLGIWPRFEAGSTDGKKYDTINQLLNRLSHDLDIDLWTLDTLWWIMVTYHPNEEDGNKLYYEVNNIWWVNQSKTVKLEIPRGFLWAPKKTKSGKEKYYWTLLSEVHKGDIILHYANGFLRFVSKASEQPSSIKRPDDAKYKDWSDEGWQVKFKHYQLDPPIPLKKFNLKIAKLEIEQGPLDIKHEVKIGYLFRLTGEALNLIQKSQPETKWPDYSLIPDQYIEEKEKSPTYTISDFLNETGHTKDIVLSWQRRLLRKKQIILQGPPGTGKTYIAQRLAKLMVSDSEGFYELVQFHPSYAYEDFIQGIRPNITDEGQLSYDLRDGRFLDFCYKAEEVPNSPCVFVIDEINRANLSRVFGELMYLLEYRDNEIHLSGGTPFRIPDNVFIIGTMNTADRSIAVVDHALRRRFSFIRLYPDYKILEGYLKYKGYPSKSLIDVLTEINNTISNPNYQIGISYFMNKNDDLKNCLPDIWVSEIESYLEEYFYDKPSKIDSFRWNYLKDNTLKEWLPNQ